PLQSGLKANELLRWHLVLLPLAGLAPGAARPLIEADTAGESLVLSRAAERTEKAKTSGLIDLPRFEQTLRERKENPPTAIEIIRNRLTIPQKLPYHALLTKFQIRPDEWTHVEEDPIGCDFPLWKLNLKSTDPRLTQSRYQMELRLEA